jgi:outer membrane receptor protein involved in Fe transport
MDTPTGVPGTTASALGVSIGGLFTTGDAGTPSQWQDTNSFIWQDTLAHTHGRHDTRFGLEIKRHEVDVYAPFSADGLLQIATFEDFLLGESAIQNGSPIGVSNVTSSTGSSGIFRKDERYTDIAAFLQDDFHLTHRLTVNAGVRYEIFGPPSDIHGPGADRGISQWIHFAR